MSVIFAEQCMRGLDDERRDNFLGASPGIVSKDKAIIDRHTVLVPTHTGYDRSLTVFPLPALPGSVDRRVAVMCTFRTSDGTRTWPFNHVVVLTLSEYESIGANPFALLRNDVFRIESTPRPTLERVSIQQERYTQEGVLTPEHISTLNEHFANRARLEALLNSLLAVTGAENADLPRLFCFVNHRDDALLESVLLTLPLCVRSSISFTTSLTEPVEKSEERLRDGISVWPEEDPAAYEVKWCQVALPSGQQASEFLQDFGGNDQPYLDISGPRLDGRNFPKHPYVTLAMGCIDDQERLLDLSLIAEQIGRGHDFFTVMDGYLRNFVGIESTSNEEFARRCGELRGVSYLLDESILGLLRERILRSMIAFLQREESPEWVQALIREYIERVLHWTRRTFPDTKAVGADAVDTRFFQIQVSALSDTLGQGVGSVGYVLFVHEFLGMISSEKRFLEEARLIFQDRIVNLVPTLLKEVPPHLNCIMRILRWYPKSISDDQLLQQIQESFTQGKPDVLRNPEQFLDQVNAIYDRAVLAYGDMVPLRASERESQRGAICERFLNVYRTILDVLQSLAPPPRICGFLIVRCYVLARRMGKITAAEELFLENMNALRRQAIPDVVRTIAGSVQDGYAEDYPLDVLLLLLTHGKNKLDETRFQILAEVAGRRGHDGILQIVSTLRRLKSARVPLPCASSLDTVARAAAKVCVDEVDSTRRAQFIDMYRQGFTAVSSGLHDQYVRVLGQNKVTVGETATSTSGTIPSESEAFGAFDAETARPRRTVFYDVGDGQRQQSYASQYISNEGCLTRCLDFIESIAIHILCALFGLVVGFVLGLVVAESVGQRLP